jgi:hypothetical protein
LDRYSNAGKPPRHAGAKDIRLRLDRGRPKPRWDVEPGQCSAKIVGERRQRTAMNMAAVVEMTVIHIEFADQLIFAGVGDADAEMSRHTETGRGRSHRRAPIKLRDSCSSAFRQKPGGTPTGTSSSSASGLGEYESVVRVSERFFQILVPDAPTPERCVEAYHIHRTRLELIAERKFRRRQWSADGNVEITGRDLREREAPPLARSFSVGLLYKGRATSSSRRRTPISGRAVVRTSV